MSAVDAPPGVVFAGRAAGEFTARPGARRLARRVLVYVAVAGTTTVALAGQNIYRPGAEILVIATMVCASLAAVAYAVRRARVRVDRGGIAWGWSAGGFRMPADRIARIDVYRDGVAGVPRRGSRWYLSARDWDRFERMPAALRSAGLPVVERGERAPLRARLQGYGLALDVLLFVDAVLATAALGLATGL